MKIRLLILSFFVGFFTGYPPLRANQSQWYIQGSVLDASNQKPIANAEVQIINLHDNSRIILKTDRQGKFRQGLELQRSYELSVIHENYFSWRKNDLDTSDPAENHSFSFQLSPIVIGKSVLLKEVDFSPNGTQLVPESEKSLQELIHLLKTNPQLIIEIGVHTDSRGDAQHNLDLSQAQAQALIVFLIKENIPEAQVQAKGYGEKYLLNHCTDGIRCSTAEHLQNRRVEFSIIGLRK